ncbi:unnamed protein product [Adineta steineri]|uniref:Uncharacterized protein n=3 Tax=Adineta steineri TaxID=433720 RepID=A0A815B2R3_9BILA|nr:unnamed protein product [Adineta steineri]CAF3860752.1 unnamed protein product [Adineta steineri]
MNRISDSKEEGTNSNKLVITFEDISNITTKYGQIPDGYQSLIWENAWYVHESEAQNYHSNTGYDHAFTGGRKYLAYNFEPNNPISIKSFNSQHPFTFHSFESNSIHRDNLQLYVQGFRRGEQVYGTVMTIQITEPTSFELEWENIDKVVWTTFGGTKHEGYHRDVKNFTITCIKITK